MAEKTVGEAPDFGLLHYSFDENEMREMRDLLKMAVSPVVTISHSKMVTEEILRSALEWSTLRSRMVMNMIDKRLNPDVQRLVSEGDNR